eukprot:scaffold159810_cov65-Cyclotella_meneghiniana.AAC.1
MERDPTYVVEKQMFIQNSFPYLEVRRPFILGVRDRKWKPTIAHHFASLLHAKTNKLTRVFTQNIDGLTNAVPKLPDDKIVAVHGCISKVNCETCGQGVDFNDFCQQVETKIKNIYDSNDGPKESTPIHCPSCGNATVKPNTVLFGSSLPQEFFDRASQDLPSTDLLIVAGTSLVVSPANSLVYNVPKDTLRVVVNNEPVGQELGIEYGSNTERDFFARGNCDEVFLDLIHELGLMDLQEERDNLPEMSVKLIDDKYGN